MTDENQDVDLHDDDEEIMEMKHGKKKMSEMDDHEADSVKSADAASDASGSAPKRKGDQSKQDPMPKTKAALMAAIRNLCKPCITSNQKCITKKTWTTMAT